MSVKIPESYREEFDKAMDFAVEKETFTPTQLAEYLEKSVMVASIMIGYMDKAGIITHGKNDDVRRVKVTPDEWMALDKNVENFVPPVEPVPEVFVPETVDLTLTDLSDILPEREKFFGGEIYFENGELFVAGDSVASSELSSVTLIPPRFLKKGVLVFLSDTGKEIVLPFKKKELDRAKALADGISGKI